MVTPSGACFCGRWWSRPGRARRWHSQLLQQAVLAKVLGGVALILQRFINELVVRAMVLTVLFFQQSITIQATYTK